MTLSTADIEMRRCVEIDALGDLTRGWNSYDAPPISAEARAKAKAVVRLLCHGDLSVAPLPSGRVGLVLKIGASDVVLEIDADGAITGGLDYL